LCLITQARGSIFIANYSISCYSISTNSTWFKLIADSLALTFSISTNLLSIQTLTSIIGLYLQNGSQAFQLNLEEGIDQVTCSDDVNSMVCVVMGWNSIRLYSFDERTSKVVVNSTISDLYPFC
jgi:hypothetical protein